MTIDEFVSTMEEDAIESIVKKMAGNSFVKKAEDGTTTEIGIKLFDKNFDISVLGNNIEFFGYDGSDGKTDLSKALTGASFVFDGIDDYIKLPYNNSQNLEKGFTFEFFGKLTGVSTLYIYKNNVYNK